MVHGMMRKGLFLAPLVVGGLWAFGGSRYAISGAVGLGMTLLSLWLSGRIIGGVAERHPQLLFAAGMGSFVLGLGVLTMIALLLTKLDLVFFPVTGLVLVFTHLGLVLWEAGSAYGRLNDRSGTPNNPDGMSSRS